MGMHDGWKAPNLTDHEMRIKRIEMIIGEKAISAFEEEQKRIAEKAIEAEIEK